MREAIRRRIVALSQTPEAAKPVVTPLRRVCRGDWLRERHRHRGPKDLRKFDLCFDGGAGLCAAGFTTINLQ
jgi:hypothetical protein